MDDVQRLEAERLRPTPPADPVDDLWRQLISLVESVYLEARNRKTPP